MLSLVCLVAGALAGGCSASVDAPAPRALLVASSIQIIAPAETLQVGQQGRMTAIVRDGGGNALPSYPVRWSTSAASVALVSDSGVVTAVAPGTASISVAADGHAASVPMSVVGGPAGPPAPPDSALDPAPPIVFADDFENGYAPKQGDAGWKTTTANNISVSEDVAHTGTHSLRFTFPGKAECLDASAEQRFSFGRNMQEVWMEYYIYYPAGGEGGSAPYYHRWEFDQGCAPSATTDNNKFLAVFGPNYGGETTGIICTWTTTKAASVAPAYPGDSRLQSAYSKAGMHGVMPNVANYDPFIRGPGDRGRWMQIRAHFRVADFGQSNGVIQVWKDGSLILSNTDLPWYDSTGEANYMTQGYLLGWANSGYTQTTNIYIDDFRIIGQNPGW